MCCSRWTVLRRRWRASRCAWPPPSCRSRRSSYRAAIRTILFVRMKKSQRKEIQEKTLPELLADGRNLRQEIFNLRLQQASAQLEKSARLRTLRRDIARIETRISSLRNQPAQPAKA